MSKQSLIRLSISTSASRNPTSWNIMLPSPRKRREKLTINCKSESAKKYPEGVENTYGIDHLKIAEATHVSDDYE